MKRKTLRGECHPNMVKISNNRSRPFSRWARQFTWISIVAFFLESADNLSTGMTYTTKELEATVWSEHESLILLRANCKTSENAEMVFEEIDSFFLSLTSPALSEWWCRPGECCRGTWSWQCSGKARRSRKWGRWRKRGWTPQLEPPPCGLVSQCDESSETCHNLKRKPTVSPTNLP